MAKLVCEQHHRRVHVLKLKSDYLPVTLVVHRNDGTRCRQGRVTINGKSYSLHNEHFHA